MVVLVQNGVKPRLTAGRTQLLYQTFALKYIQIPIDRTQTHTGNAVADNLVQFSSSHMPARALKRFQNNFSLKSTTSNGHNPPE